MKVMLDTEISQGGKCTVEHKPTGQIGLIGLGNSFRGLYEAFPYL